MGPLFILLGGLLIFIVLFSYIFEFLLERINNPIHVLLIGGAGLLLVGAILWVFNI